MSRRIYLDCNSSTALDARVLEVLIQELKEEEGNPSSIHFHGQQCRRKLDESRQIIARFLGVRPNEIIFTSGGTEGACLLLNGVMQHFTTGHIITSSVEHSCVFETVKDLEKKGYQASFLPVGSLGAVEPHTVKEALRPDTRLITLMAVNNETGVKTDIESIAAIAQQAHIPFVVDGVALLGKESFNIPQGVSAIFFSGHKIHAPKGIGFSVCKQTLKMNPLCTGGTQEFGRRAGTENLPGIIALAQAISILANEQEMITSYLSARRNQLEEGVMARLEGVLVNGDGQRVSNTTNLSFVGVDGESLLMNLDLEGISVSHGSACSSGALEPSRILLNMGLPLPRANSSIRFSVGRHTTEEDIARAVDGIVRVVERLRKKGY